MIMRYFLDAEFEENGSTIIPISLGMVSEDNRQLYLINSDYIGNWKAGKHEIFPAARDFLQSNVLNHITANDFFDYGDSLRYWPGRILEFISDFGQYSSRDEIELWGYYGAYDHVCLAQRFGPMIALPEPIPMFTHEIKQLQANRECPPRPAELPEHNALSDAIYQKLIWETWK